MIRSLAECQWLSQNIKDKLDKIIGGGMVIVGDQERK